MTIVFPRLHLRRWLRGWEMHLAAFLHCLRKGHGAGYTARNAWLCAACVRYLVDGQHRGAREPITGLRRDVVRAANRVARGAP